MAGKPESEREFGDWVVAFALMHRWLVSHQRPAQDRHGRWKTAIQGTPGLPDLVLVSAKRRLIIFAELKSQQGRTSPAQDVWLEELRAASCVPVGTAGVLVRLWRPSDRPEIEKLLSS